MNKKIIRLTESDLHRIVKESVNNILNEWHGTSKENKDAYASVQKLLSRLNQAKRNLMSVTGPVSMDATLTLHPGNEEGRVYDTKNVVGDYLIKAIEYIEKAQSLFGYSSYGNSFDNNKLYDDHLHPREDGGGRWLNKH